jgi:hypothetical protein
LSTDESEACVIIVPGIAVIAFIFFVSRRNLKDEKHFEETIKNDYHHPTRGEKADIESEGRLK